MPRGDFRRRADAVRSIPLWNVLRRWGAKRDRHDRSKWLTERGPLSVTGDKFFNWHLQRGGGGAIDLAMHLGEMDAASAIRRLEQMFGSATDAASAPSCSCRDASGNASQLRLPVANAAKLDRVVRYLTKQRALAEEIIQPLIEAGKVYADQHGNAVFLMVAGIPNRPIGAELRGTGPCAWRGLAPGTRKDAGYFWVGIPDAGKVVLCESAIDAISCFQLHGPCICISTAGARPDAHWLPPLLARGYDIYCGFDDDPTGNGASCQMIKRHPSIKRLLPHAHDWNDALRAAHRHPSAGPNRLP